MLSPREGVLHSSCYDAGMHSSTCTLKQAEIYVFGPTEGDYSRFKKDDILRIKDEMSKEFESKGT